MAPLKHGGSLKRRMRATAALLLLLEAAPAFPAMTPPLEQAIKASYITKFAPFIQWPAAAFATPSSPFMICLAGHDDYGTLLDEVARGQKVRGHPIQVRRIGDTVPSGGCHILVMGADRSGSTLSQLGGQPILTVTERSDRANGGMISFVRQGGRVRFEIDNSTARAAHLVISSKLLSLAVTVIQ